MFLLFVISAHFFGSNWFFTRFFVIRYSYFNIIKAVSLQDISKERKIFTNEKALKKTYLWISAL